MDILVARLAAEMPPEKSTALLADIAVSARGQTAASSSKCVASVDASTVMHDADPGTAMIWVLPEACAGLSFRVAR